MKSVVGAHFRTDCGKYYTNEAPEEGVTQHENHKCLALKEKERVKNVELLRGGLLHGIGSMTSSPDFAPLLLKTR